MCAMNPRLLRPLATGFNPKSIAELGMWLDASNTSSLTFNGSTVSEWRDLSGNDRHVSQATPGLQPTGDNRTQNGRRVLDFDGGDQLLGNSASLNILRNVPGGTVMAVLAYDVLTSSTLSPTSFIICNGSNQNQSRLALVSVAPETGTVGTGGRRLDANSFASINAAYTATTPVVITSVLDYANSDAFLYFDGAEVASTTSFQTDGNTSDTDSVAVAVGSGVSLNYFNGGIGEILVWPRVLTDAERQRAEGYLAWKWGLQGKLPTNHPYAYAFPGLGSQPQPSNSEAQDWISRVYSNGGTVSTSTANAVNTFCNAIDSAGIRDRFYRLNLFAGTGLNAALVPLYRGPTSGGTQYGNTTDTNNGPFVSGDYVETGASGGLLGNGTSKYLDTGLNQNFNGNVGHASVYHKGNVTLQTESLLRASDGVAHVVGVDVIPTHLRGFWGATSPAQVTSASGHIVAARTSSTLLTLYLNGTSSATQTASVSPSLAAVPFYVFGSNQNGSAASWSDARLQGYSLGDEMDGTEVAAFSSALIAFQTALERN